MRAFYVAIGAAVCVLVQTSVAAQLSLEDPEQDIIAPDAELEVVYDDGFLTEGPAVAPDGTVFFSDITFSRYSGMQAGHIMRYYPASGKTVVYRSPSGMSNGLKFDAKGRLLACEGADYGGRRVTRTDLATGKAEIVVGLFWGRPFNAPNDLSLDEKGRIYFSDPKYLGHEAIDQPVYGVYRIDPDSSVHLIITDAGKPNGVAVAPDQQSLYVVSNDNGAFAFDRLPEDAPVHSARMALLAYDLDPDGTTAFREVLHDYSPQDGPDGLVCDIEGNLYVAVRDTTRFGIAVYSSTGKERAFIPTPELPTNVAFGRGSAKRTLYITYGDARKPGGRGSLARIQLQKEGYQLPDSK